MNKRNFALTVILLAVIALALIYWINFIKPADRGVMPPPDAEQSNKQEPDSSQGDEELKVDLYYYNFLADKAIDEIVPCSPDAVQPVHRTIAKSDDYIRQTLEMLLRGNITEEEKSYGFMSEFPDPGLSIESLELSDDGLLTIKIKDENGFLSGGSCRVGLLYAQIEKTALQFIEVNKVIIQPEELLQP